MRLPDGTDPALKEALGQALRSVNNNIYELDQTIRLNNFRLEELLREIFRRLALVERAAFGNLLHMSWYGAAHQDIGPMRDDMDVLEALGYNGGRVWATWGTDDGVDPDVDSPLNFEGQIVTGPMDKLRQFIGEANTRGWTTEVVLSHNKLGTEARHKVAIANLATGIGDLPGWFLDMANEHDNISYPIGGLYAQARDAFPAVQLTASLSGSVDSMAGIYNADYDDGIAWDLLTPHMPRTTGWASETEARVGDFVAALDSASAAAGKVHLNEENGVGGTGGTDPSAASEWTVAGEGARLGGAFGTSFFTIAGFNLKGGKSLIDSLGGIEVQGYENLATGWIG